MQTTLDAASIKTNDALAHHILREALKSGVTEFCVCPGARNSPLVFALDGHESLKTYYWFEERSAAFFALGRSKATNKPVAVITTSGTAAAELLPATIEAYYTGIPLLLITADRPRRFRGTGAPQTAEQVGLFGVYASFEQDIALDEGCLLKKWSRQQPAHLNVCFEEPESKGRPFVIYSSRDQDCDVDLEDPSLEIDLTMQHVDLLNTFLREVQNPFVVVGTLKKEARDPICSFLKELNAPVLLEGTSGLREDPRLAHLRITNTEKILHTATHAGYPIDAVLRIGGVPTNRLWRDLEEKEGSIRVCSVNDYPFSGLSWGHIVHGDMAAFFSEYRPKKTFSNHSAGQWLESDKQFQQKLSRLFAEEPNAETSLIYQLSKQIPRNANIYLGNSLPIREWDLAASWEDRANTVTASRGINGIDGQISTFLGYSLPHAHNWALIGDLTALYDMAGPWILSQLEDRNVNIVVINNSGGQIFARKFSSSAFLNSHLLNFGPLAAMWNLTYERWTSIPDVIETTGNRLIEIIPDADATKRFWDKLS